MIDRVGRERNGASLDLRGEVLEIRELLSREPGGAQRLVGRRHQLGGCRRTIAVQGVHAAEDRRRRLPRQLLIDDRPNERVEVRSFAARLQPAWSDAVDHGRENRIDAPEMTNRWIVHALKNALRVNRHASAFNRGTVRPF